MDNAFGDWLRFQWFRWKHRNDTMEQRKDALKKSWGNVMEASQTLPETREFIDAKEAMDKVIDTLYRQGGPR